MGFTIYYRSTRPVTADQSTSIRHAADTLNVGRTWLSSEPVCFHPDQKDGRLLGRSKPNFDPHPDDVAAARREALPDGTVRDMIDILCRLSREYGVDWEFSHDYDPGPVGFIRNGVCDRRLLELADSFADLGDILAGELGLADEEVGDDDDEPRILKFPGR